MDDITWYDDAACRGVGVALFYSDEPADISQALQLCRECPVRRPCLDDAMDRRDFDGIWGGVPEVHRRRTLRRQDRERRRQQRVA